MSRPISPAVATTLQIPKRYQEAKNNIQKRKVSATSALSNLSEASTVEDFIKWKEEELDADYEVGIITKQGLEEMKDQNLITPEECFKRIRAIHNNSDQNAIERNLFKRYRKFLIEDLKNTTPEMPTYGDLAKAYADAHRLWAVKASDAVTREAPKNERTRFKEKALKAYAAKREVFADPATMKKVLYKQELCHLTGWHSVHTSNDSICKVAHIVPHSLATTQTAYIFGVADSELIKKDLRNSLCLHSIIEAMFDNGEILILPIKTKHGEPSRWECIVTDLEARKSEEIFVNGLSIKDLHKSELKFMNEFRPANRYMYYKYITTFLVNDRIGTMDWLPDFDEAGKMWASPGPYLRNAFLTALAQSIGDVFLPEVFFEMVKCNSFDESESSPKVSAEQEELMRETSRLEILETRKKIAERRKANEMDSEIIDDSEGDDSEITDFEGFSD